MYLSISPVFIWSCCSLVQALPSFWVSWYCLENSYRNCSQTAGILSWLGLRPSSIVLMSLILLATSGPFMSMTVKATFFIRELNPATLAFRCRYAFTSSVKSSAHVLLPVNTSWSFPIDLMSLTGATFCWGAPPPPPPPPPSPPPPPPPPPNH